MSVGVIAIVAWLLPGSAGAQDGVTPGELRSYATEQSIGVEWDVAGDDDHDAVATVRYRPAGAPGWRSGWPLFRVDFEGANMLAGSLMYLRPGVDHDVEIELSDPDGGGELRTIVVATRPMPTRPVGGRVLHVAPGAGGGTGTEADPFLGIAAADDAARPGDVLMVHAGDYGPDRVFFDAAGEPGRYVAWVSVDDDPARLPDLRVRADHVWIEGFDISAPDNAVRNEGPAAFVVLRGNRITGCHYCVHLNDGAAGWWISDNVIVGDQEPASGSLSGEGIELSHTPDHTVAHNSISRVADGVSYPHRNVDIFGNDIFETSDDGLEPDAGLSNIRIFGNRIHHAHNNGITFQPMSGAPWYVVRNQVIGSNESVLKVRDAVDRVLLAHNTFVGWGRVYQNQAGWIRNMTSRNNVWITMTGDYLWEDTGSPDVPDSFRTDLDHDGFAWPDGAGMPLFKWRGERFADLAALQAGTSIEPNAIRVPMSCFASLDVPGPPPAVVPPQLVALTEGCVAVDAGAVMPGINDGFVGEGPDLGAHELGAPAARYGPRDLDVAPPSPPTGVRVD